MSPGIVAESDLSGNLKSEYVFFGGKRVARKDLPSGAVSYYFSDFLDTANVITDSAGNIKEDEDFNPWGGELPFVSSDPNKYKFGGHEQDAESGLYDYGARHYNSALSRFMTPDWGGPLPNSPDPVPWAELDNPQSLNLYGYVHNNPTSLADPDGHDCVVQSSTGSSSEKVNVSSGNCDNVKVGDGQTKTFVDGTVTSISKGADGRSIDIGYTANDGSGAVGITNANFVPYPDSPNTAYNFGNNAQRYATLNQASKTVDRIAIATAAVAGANLAMIAASGGALTTLGDLTITPTAGEQAYAEKLLAEGGKRLVQKAIRTLSKRLAEHEAKLQGGLKYPGTVEREVGNFIRTIKALTDVLK